MATPVPAGFAVGFDAIDDHIDLDPTPFGTPQDVTVECWVKLYEVGGKIHFLITNSQDDFNNGFSLTWIGGDFIFTAAFAIGTSANAVTTSTIVAGRWYHVAGVHDPVLDEVRIYLDGVLEGTTAYASGITYAGGRDLLFGKQFKAFSQAARFLHGEMDEVRLWNTVRTGVQIKNNRFKEIDPTTSGLVGYYRLNEGTGTTATDLSASSNDGTLSGGAFYLDGCPFVDQKDMRIKRAAGIGGFSSAVGLVIRDNANRANNAVVNFGWTEATPANVSILGNEFDFILGGSDIFRATPANPPQPNDLIIQANVFLDVVAGLIGVLRVRSDFPGGVTTLYDLLMDKAGGKWELRELTAGAPTNSSVFPEVIPGGTFHAMRLVLEDIGPTTRVEGLGALGLPSPTDLSTPLVPKVTFTDLSPIPNAPPTDQYNLSISGVGRAEEFFLCGRNVVVTNLQSGFKVQLDSDTPVVESGGVVTIGVDGRPLPYTTIKILNATDDVMEEVDLTGGGWGGDVIDAVNIGDFLHRVVEGLVMYDQFIDRTATGNNVGKPVVAGAEIPNWNEREAGAADLFIEQSGPNFFLGHTVSNVTSTLEREDPELPQDYIIQANLQPRSGSGFVFLDANLNVLGAPGGADLYDFEASVAANTLKARVVVNSAVAESTSVAQTIVSPNTYQFRLIGELVGGPARDLRVYMAQGGAAINGLLIKHGVLTLKVTHNTSIIISEPFYGITLHERAAGYHFFVCGRNVKVTGIPTGGKVQIESDTPIVETAGEVDTVIDTRELPFATISVLDATNAVIGTISPLDANGWEGGGGDEYVFEGPVVPPPPPPPPPLPPLTTPVRREELEEPFKEFIRKPEIHQMFLPVLPLADQFFVPKFIFDIGPIVEPVPPQLDPFLAQARAGYPGSKNQGGGGVYGFFTHGGVLYPETPVGAIGTGTVGVGAEGTIANVVGGMGNSGQFDMPVGLFADTDTIRCGRLKASNAIGTPASHNTGESYTKLHRHIGSFGYYYRTITRIENLNIANLAFVRWGYGAPTTLGSSPFPYLIMFEVLPSVSGTLARCVVADEASVSPTTVTFVTEVDLLETAHLLEILLIPSPAPPQCRFYIDGQLVFFENTVQLPPDATGRTDAGAESAFGVRIATDISGNEVRVRWNWDRIYAFPYNDVVGAG